MTLAPLCSREYRAIVSVGHIAARMPRTLFAAIADPMPAPSIAIPASASSRATLVATAAGNVRVVYRLGACRCLTSSTAMPRPRRCATRPLHLPGRYDRSRSPRGGCPRPAQGRQPSTCRRSRRGSRSPAARPACPAPAASHARPATSSTVAPISSMRASASVMMSNVSWGSVMLSYQLSAVSYQLPVPSSQFPDPSPSRFQLPAARRRQFPR